MKMTKWKYKDEILLFPYDWSEKDVVAYANTDIKVCTYCGKVDAGLRHYNDCSPEREAIRQQNLDYYWK